MTCFFSLDNVKQDKTVRAVAMTIAAPGDFLMAQKKILSQSGKNP